MTESLTAADLERMRAEHQPGCSGAGCLQCANGESCDAARLLEHMTLTAWWHGFSAYSGRAVVLPKEYDIGRALCGPSTSEELDH